MKKAFTLAEVLITLGIIGVVAALTIPTLVQNTQEKSTVTAVKKSFSILSQAYLMAINDNGTPDSWGLGGFGDVQGAENMLTTIAPYFKISKNCGTAGGCWAIGDTKSLNGSDTGINHNGSNFATAQLPDGSDISFDIHSKDCTASYSASGSGPMSQVCGTMNVDIDGMKGKNQFGVDVFVFWITKTGIVPLGIEDDSWFFGNCNKVTGAGGCGCAAWVIYKENLDYLHCNNLSWNGPIKCH